MSDELLGVYLTYNENGMITELNAIEKRLVNEQNVRYVRIREEYGFVSMAISLEDAFRILSSGSELIRNKTLQQQVSEFPEPNIFLTKEEFDSINTGKLKILKVNIETKELEECDLYEVVDEDTILHYKKQQIQNLFVGELNKGIPYEFPDGTTGTIQYGTPSQITLLSLKERARELIDRESSDKIIFRDAENNIHELTGQEFIDMFFYTQEQAEKIAMVKWDAKENLKEKKGNKKDLNDFDLREDWKKEKEKKLKDKGKNK